jgi:hypothetical protein
MREITPLHNTTRQAASRVTSPTHFVFKTRIWVAISMIMVKRLQKNRITAKILAQAIATPASVAQLHPVTGVRCEPPIIKVRGRSSSHT